MDTNNNLKIAWADYRKSVMPADCSQTQVTETERGFYAGAFAILEVMMKIEDESEDFGVEVLKGLSAEIMVFVAHTTVARESQA